MTFDRSHSDTVVRVANKVMVEGGFPKYRSSDALPAPKIFTIRLIFVVVGTVDRKIGFILRVEAPFLSNFLRQVTFLT